MVLAIRCNRVKGKKAGSPALSGRIVQGLILMTPNGRLLERYVLCMAKIQCARYKAITFTMLIGMAAVVAFIAICIGVAAGMALRLSGL